MLFCGALCLTGCLKNEESASVAQVRIAKANELNSIADLNKAKAQAEVIYANAEATIANAEAKLREANAALVLAQAETEKVRAELLKVQVQLAEVTVEEEKVKLQLLEADLEKHLAEVEAAIAKAEAEKQGWINVLNHAIADAERQAIADAEEILKAEDALEEYLLKQEGKKAAAAKKVSKQYFDALEQIQALQFQQIKTKAQKALVEAGALEIRDAIHFAIDQIDEEIAKKEALVEYLKEYQTMTPEEAEEALKAARTELSEAYTAYKAAVAMEDAADDALNGNPGKGITGIKNMTADYTLGWKFAFKDDFKDLVADSEVYYGGHGDVDGVQYYGVYVIDDDDDEENDEFIPLWTTLGSAQAGYRKWAAVEPEYQRYPDIDVYEGEGKDFIVLESNTYVPAKIDFEKVNEVLDALVAEAEADAEAVIEKEEEENIPARIEGWQEKVDAYTDSLDLHTKYVNERKAAIAAAEQAYLDELEANEELDNAVATSWKAFQEYMLVKYDVDRMLFVRQNEAQEAYDEAKGKADNAKSILDAARASIPEKMTDVETAKENEAKAEGEYRAAAAAGIPQATKDAYEEAKSHWNPDFDFETAGHDSSVPQKWTDGAGEDASDIQNNLLNAQDSLKLWQDAEYDAQMTLWRTPAGVTGHDAAQQAFDEAKAQRQAYELKVTSRQTDANTAERIFAEAKRNYDAANKQIAATEKWNPDFGAYGGYIENYDTEAIDTTGTLSKPKTGTNKGKWVKGNAAAGTAQAGLIDAVIAYRSAVNDTTATGSTDPKAKTSKDKYNDAKGVEDDAKDALDAANIALIAALKGVPESEVDLEKDDIEDYLDEQAIVLWKAYQDAKDEAAEKTNKAWGELIKLYAFNPNHIGEYDDLGINELWAYLWKAQFSWVRSSYNVDYTAQILCPDGEYRYIAQMLHEVDLTDPDEPEFTARHSFAYKIEVLQSFIDGKDEYLAWFKEGVEEQLKAVVKDIEEIRPNVNSYEAHEASYLAWIESISAYEAALNEAKKATFDAQQEVKLAQAIYDALDAVANGGLWVYDPDQTIFKKVYGHEATAEEKAEGEGQIRSGDFTWITVNDEIERLEGNIEMISAFVGSQLIPIMIDAIADLNPAPANVIVGNNNNNNNNNSGNFVPAVGPSFEMFDSIAGLTFAKTLLQEALSKGKVALQVVIDAFDAELAVLDEKIDLYTKLAATYKGIMNALLGIVDEADVEGETGPLDGEGEGDDEE